MSTQLSLWDAPETLTDYCPNCGFGERFDMPESEYWTVGYFYICDCGFSTVQPKITYQAWADCMDNLRHLLRNTIQERDRNTDTHADKQALSFERRAAHLRKQYDEGKSSPVMHGMSRKTFNSLSAIRQQIHLADYNEDALRHEITALRNEFSAYSAWYDDNVMSVR